MLQERRQACSASWQVYIEHVRRACCTGENGRVHVDGCGVIDDERDRKRTGARPRIDPLAAPRDDRRDAPDAGADGAALDAGIRQQDTAAASVVEPAVGSERGKPSRFRQAHGPLCTRLARDRRLRGDCRRCVPLRPADPYLEACGRRRPPQADGGAGLRGDGAAEPGVRGRPRPRERGRRCRTEDTLHRCRRRLHPQDRVPLLRLGRLGDGRARPVRSRNAGDSAETRQPSADHSHANGGLPDRQRALDARARIARRRGAIMPKLSFIESEAMRLVGRMPEANRRARQQALIDLCNAHWPEIRGPEPATPLAHALWSIAPPRADLLADLVATGDRRLNLLLGSNTAQGFALLVLAEIERGDAEGIRLAHAPMMLFDTPAAGARYAEGVAAALHGRRPPPHLHPHTGKPPLWKALACIAGHSGRTDLAAVLCVIGALASRPANGAEDAEVQALRSNLGETGVHFLAIDDDHISFTLHDHAHPPVRARQLGEMLGEIRQAWLA